MNLFVSCMYNTHYLLSICPAVYLTLSTYSSSCHSVCSPRARWQERLCPASSSFPPLRIYPCVATSRKTQQVCKPPSPSGPVPSCFVFYRRVARSCVRKMLDRRGCKGQQPLLPRVSTGYDREYTSAMRGQGASDRVPRRSRDSRSGACDRSVALPARHQSLPPCDGDGVSAAFSHLPVSF